MLLIGICIITSKFTYKYHYYYKYLHSTTSTNLGINLFLQIKKNLKIREKNKYLKCMTFFARFFHTFKTVINIF